ncbi:MAG: YfiR/HmsC family protein [Pseudomonadota bacterium]
MVFEINLTKVRASGLDISSKLLQLAVKVHQ